GLRDRGRRVSRASVYRTLPLLVKSGLLRDVHSSEKHSHYEHIFGHRHHDHLICTKCGRTIEFNSPMIEKLQTEICNQHGFWATGHKLEITGLCDACRAKEARNSTSRQGHNCST
ncbi:MAG: Fur family transcriptional regulator, partial [Bacillota bacterium]